MFEATGTKIAYYRKQHPKIGGSGGVQHIFVPMANPAEFVDVSDVSVRARALESRVCETYANLRGTEGEPTYAGDFAIAGENGKLQLRLWDCPSFGIVDTNPSR